MQAPLQSGLLFQSDARDNNFKYTSNLSTLPPIRNKVWWADGWWGDQKNTPHCGAYSWLHLLEDGPVIHNATPDRQVPLINPQKYYDECKKIDGLAGEGTTIRAGAALAKRLGLISEYRWATTVEDVIEPLLIFGPVVAGTHWYSDMDGQNGKMKASGSLVGGHAYVINGVDLNSETFRVKNSYGKRWGRNGFGYLPFRDMEKLLADGGSVVVPFEVKVSSVPQI